MQKRNARTRNRAKRQEVGTFRRVLFKTSRLRYTRPDMRNKKAPDRAERMVRKMDEGSVEITDLDREALGEQVKDGYTSGRLDSENGKHISWSIDMDVWVD